MRHLAAGHLEAASRGGGNAVQATQACWQPGYESRVQRQQA